MITELPKINRFLILAPHPDDEALGCCGTCLLLHNKVGYSAIAFITNGERLHGKPSEIIAEMRIKEAHRCCSLLGVKKNFFLGIPDGEVRSKQALLHEKLLKIIDEIKPELIFSPSLFDYHQDHIATAKVSMRLFRQLQSFKLAFYEIYSTIRFSHLIDITEVVEHKRDIIMNYQTSLYGKPEVYVHAILGLNAHRSIYTQKKGYYEAFYILDPNHR